MWFKYLGSIILSITVLLSSRLVSASTWSYKWENTYINVPIYSSIYDYSDLPLAKLYRDNKYLSDARITYNTNGDWLYYLKDVNTNVPGEYLVWYKAIETNYRPGTCNNYKQLITFNVYDDIHPQIHILQPEITIPLNTKSLEIIEGKHFTITENVPGYNVSVNTEAVILNQIGRYKVEIVVSDKSNNIAKEILYINVVDSTGPVINLLTQSNPIELEKGKEVDWRDYLSAVDEVDGDVFASLIIEERLDLDNIGNYNGILFSFFDREGNKTEIRLNIKVVDTIPPELVLTTSQITLEYLQDFGVYNFRQYIKTALDGQVDMIDEVEIDTSNLLNSVGIYYVYYSLVDEDLNTSNAILKVNVVSSQKPSLELTNIKILVGEEINFLDYIKVQDNSDANVIDTLTIDTTNYNNTEAGIYYVNVTCHNSSGLYASGTIKVEVLNANDVASFTSNTNLILGIIGGLAGVVFLFYYLWKKRKDSKIDI